MSNAPTKEQRAKGKEQSVEIPESLTFGLCSLISDFFPLGH
jgi:hypothetical protein